LLPCCKRDLVIATTPASIVHSVRHGLPRFRNALGCSFADIDWKKEGHGSSKLELPCHGEGWFYEAHRAEVTATHCWPYWAKAAHVQSDRLAQLIAASRLPSYDCRRPAHL